jgi:hypothetical protein
MMEISFRIKRRETQPARSGADSTTPQGVNGD